MEIFIKGDSLITKLKETLPGASSVDTRNILGSISFKLIGDDLELASTDGTIMLKNSIDLKPWNEEEDNTYRDCDFVLSLEQIKKLIKCYKSANKANTSHRNIITINIKDQSKSFREREVSFDLGKESNMIIDFITVDGEFPDYNKILEQYEFKKKFQVTLGFNILEKLYKAAKEQDKAAKEQGGSWGRIEFNFDKDWKPDESSTHYSKGIRAQISTPYGSQITSILMPIKQNEDDN